MPINSLKKIFYIGLLISIPAFLLVSGSIIYPFVTVKALVFRSLMLFLLPIYLTLWATDKNLKPNFKNPISIAVVVFFLASLLSAFSGINFNRSLWGNFERMGGVYNLAFFVLFYFYLEMLFKINAKNGAVFFKSLVWLGAITSLYGILTKLGMSDGLYPDSALPDRVSSIFGNPIFFASFLILPMFLAAFFALQNKGEKSAWLWWGLSFVQLLGIYVSATRGAEVGIAAGIGIAAIIFLFLAKNRKVKFLGFGAVCAALGLYAALIIFSSHLPAQLNRLTTFSDNNTKARVIQWGMALTGFKDRPLLGVGPENYYFIANKYFNPELYKYDSSWFDKPHNYQIEILSTQGLIGFLAYAAIIILGFYALHKAYKREVLTLAEFCVLVAGAAAYQVQNLFVFDTVAAAFSFFAFMGLIAFLWPKLQPEVKAAAKEKSKIYNLGAMGNTVLAVSALAAIYTFYLTDFLPARAMYDLNMGVSISLKKPDLTNAYFQAAGSYAMNYDLDDTAKKYEEFTSALVLNESLSSDKNFTSQVVDQTISQMQAATKQTDSDPVLWFKLANMLATKVYLSGAPYDKSIETVINKSVSLAPARVEPKLYVVQSYQSQKDWPKAIEALLEIIKINDINPLYKWRLALMYRQAGDLKRAVFMAELAQSQGYKFTDTGELKWLVNYYADKKDYRKVIGIYEQATVLEPSNYQLWASLATAYATVGDKEKAIAAAQRVGELSPESKPGSDLFIKNLLSK